MSGCKELFEEKVGAVGEKMLGGGSFEELQERISPEINIGERRRFAAFVSVCDKMSRARVFRAAADTLAEAWSEACRKAGKYVALKDMEPLWVKTDIIKTAERQRLSDVIKTVADGYNEFFRRGIAFDDEFETALIEAEMNGNRVISYKKQTIELTTVNKYLSSLGLKTLTALPEEVILFDCISFFCGEDGSVCELYGDGMCCGRRIIDGMDKQTALEVVSTSSEYLSMQLGMDGKFDYGRYPINDRPIKGYNTMRHAASIWSLICAYRLTGDKFTLGQLEKAIGYMVENTYAKYSPVEGKDNTVYLAEPTSQEVKVGANGVAIIMLTEYMDAVGTDKFAQLCRELGNGILELFDKRTGEFFHVLHFPTLAPKDKFRTVYYDGECVFALCRLYGLTRDRKWLDAAQQAVDMFIRKNYTQYRDHWIAYSMNEITKYLPEERYFAFALKNAQVNLKKIYRCKTTYHTYLELLTITFELYSRIKREGYAVAYLDKFDTEYFVKTIFHRAEYMLNGYCYPEYVMYLKYPAGVLGAFFVRHDAYRIRIDDIQHFCGAYYSFYRHYEELDELRKSFAERGTDAE